MSAQAAPAPAAAALTFTTLAGFEPAPADAGVHAPVDISEAPAAVRVDITEAARTCVVCLEPLVFADTGLGVDNAVASLSSALPADLPCGHGCCAACLGSYLRVAVPRAARSSSELRVLCPGVLPHGADDDAVPLDSGPIAGGWDIRCHNALPDSLLTPYLPPTKVQAASSGALPQRTPSNVQQLLDNGRSEIYLRLHTRPCAWCGARSVRAGGCNTIRCAACERQWCWSCGSRSPRTCLCAAEEGSALADAVRWARSSRSALQRIVRWPAVLLALVAAPALYFVALLVFSVVGVLDKTANASWALRSLAFVAFFLAAPLWILPLCVADFGMICWDLYCGFASVAE